MQSMQPGNLMTTAELATHLRLAERTVYDMAARGTVPHVRVTGKLLFPRRLIDAWIDARTEWPGPGIAPPPIVAGSDDPLLDWALRASGAGLAVRAVGSAQGLAELAAGRAVMAGCHLRDPDGADWNIAAVRAALPRAGVVVIAWARRVQGLIAAPGNPLAIASPADAVGRGLRVALRAEGAGAQALLTALLAADGLAPDAVTAAPRRAATHADLAAMVAAGEADWGIGLQAAAAGLHFQPLVTDEAFDLVLPRRAYFDPPVQALLAFARGPDLARRAALWGGYDVSGLGAVRWNGD